MKNKYFKITEGKFLRLNVLGLIQKVSTFWEGKGGTLKEYENVKGERGSRGKAYVRYFSLHISMIKHVSNLSISCLAGSTHLLAAFKSMTCK